MKYRLFGNSGLRVSELCLGTMTFGEDWGWGAGAEACQQMVDAFAGKGGNFLDTANFYTKGTSEKILGDLIAKDRDYWGCSPPNIPSAPRNTRTAPAITARI